MLMDRFLELTDPDGSSPVRKTPLCESLAIWTKGKRLGWPVLEGLRGRERCCGWVGGGAVDVSGQRGESRRCTGRLVLHPLSGRAFQGKQGLARCLHCALSAKSCCDRGRWGPSASLPGLKTDFKCAEAKARCSARAALACLNPGSGCSVCSLLFILLSVSPAATSSAHLEDLAYLDEQRHAPLRTSLRMPRQAGGAGRGGQDLRGNSTGPAPQSRGCPIPERGVGGGGGDRGIPRV